MSQLPTFDRLEKSCDNPDCNKFVIDSELQVAQAEPEPETSYQLEGEASFLKLKIPREPPSEDEVFLEKVWNILAESSPAFDAFVFEIRKLSEGTDRPIPRFSTIDAFTQELQAAIKNIDNT